MSDEFVQISGPHSPSSPRSAVSGTFVDAATAAAFPERLSAAVLLSRPQTPQELAESAVSAAHDAELAASTDATVALADATAASEAAIAAKCALADLALEHDSAAELHLQAEVARRAADAAAAYALEAQQAAGAGQRDVCKADHVVELAVAAVAASPRSGDDSDSMLRNAMERASTTVHDAHIRAEQAKRDAYIAHEAAKEAERAAQAAMSVAVDVSPPISREPTANVPVEAQDNSSCLVDAAPSAIAEPALDESSALFADFEPDDADTDTVALRAALPKRRRPTLSAATVPHSPNTTTTTATTARKSRFHWLDRMDCNPMTGWNPVYLVCVWLWLLALQNVFICAH
eukprot:TRINITY_DN934_c0_g1_i2.p1 TRINITY_DN934_c0_g1~~TRINITY_DN934_c0_g1_i2.p1  ORF type:complete len:347 (-),score=104.70 TRINITY_DN934_c0_g1_i2:78-1118(-)